MKCRSLNIQFLSVLFVSCQTSQLSIVSNPPGAEVSVYVPTSNVYVSVGVTPLEVDETNLREKSSLSEDRVASLRIRARGFETENVFLDFKAQPSQKLKINLQQNKISPLNPQSSKFPDSLSPPNTIRGDAISHLIEAVQNIHQLTRSKNHERAYAMISELTFQYPRVYYLWDMKGSLAIMLDRQEEALIAYKKSLSLNRDNELTRQTLARIIGRVR